MSGTGMSGYNCWKAAPVFVRSANVPGVRSAPIIQRTAQKSTFGTDQTYVVESASIRSPKRPEKLDDLLVAGRKTIIVAPTLDETVKIRDPALAGLVYPFPGTASHNGSPATMCTLAPGNRPVAAK